MHHHLLGMDLLFLLRISLIFCLFWYVDHTLSSLSPRRLPAQGTGVALIRIEEETPLRRPGIVFTEQRKALSRSRGEDHAVSLTGRLEHLPETGAWKDLQKLQKKCFFGQDGQDGQVVEYNV